MKNLLFITCCAKSWKTVLKKNILFVHTYNIQQQQQKANTTTHSDPTDFHQQFTHYQIQSVFCKYLPVKHMLKGIVIG